MTSTWYPLVTGLALPEFPIYLNDWVKCNGSFMARLAQNNVKDTVVKVIQQDWFTPHTDECQALNISSHSPALIREVLIANPPQYWMYARTVFPKEILTNKEEAFVHLENRSLGSILFKDHWQRKEIFVSYLPSSSEWYEKISSYVSLIVSGLWARRSVFYLNEKKLLLTEVFLPDIELVK